MSSGKLAAYFQNIYSFVSTPLGVCLWVRWFLRARFLLEYMSILFHLTGLTLFSAKACFISTHFNKILMLSDTLICSPECAASSLLGLGLSTELHQY